MLLYKKCSVLQFVETENPVEILGQYNQIVFDIVNIGENLQIMKMFEKQPETTEEIKNCLNDLKVLNSKDFKGLLKWREKMKKLIQKEEESDNDSKEISDEEENLTQDQKENLLHLKIEDHLEKEVKKKKKKLKKKERLKEKFKLRTGLAGHIVDDEFEAPTDIGLFSLSQIKKKELLDDVVNLEDTDQVMNEIEDENKKIKEIEIKRIIVILILIEVNMIIWWNNV